MLIEGIIKIDSIADCLPRGAVMKTRECAPGVETRKFMGYMKDYVSDVRNQATNVSKDLLLFTLIFRT